METSNATLIGVWHANPFEAQKAINELEKLKLSSGMTVALEIPQEYVESIKKVLASNKYELMRKYHEETLNEIQMKLWAPKDEKEKIQLFERQREIEIGQYYLKLGHYLQKKGLNMVGFGHSANLPYMKNLFLEEGMAKAQNDNERVIALQKKMRNFIFNVIEKKWVKEIKKINPAVILCGRSHLESLKEKLNIKKTINLCDLMSDEKTQAENLERLKIQSEYEERKRAVKKERKRRKNSGTTNKLKKLRTWLKRNKK